MNKVVIKAETRNVLCIPNNLLKIMANIVRHLFMLTNSYKTTSRREEHVHQLLNRMNKLYNDIVFMDRCLFVFEQIDTQFNNKLKQFKENFFETYNDKLNNSNVVLFNEYCGFITKKHNNGYTICCDIHKYLHLNINDHPFILKSKRDIIKQKYYKEITLLFDEYINILYNSILNMVQIYVR